jgi:AcrR family transcriptional regulator
MARRDPIDHPALMAAAMTILDADGFEGLTLSRVAAHLGVGPSALYTHVAGLAGLHHAAGIEATRRLTVEVRDAAIGRGGDDAVRSVADAYRAYARRHPGRLTATMRNVEVDDAMDAANAELDAVFVLLSEARGLSGAGAGRAARNVRRAIHGFVVVEHATGDDARADRDYRELVESLCSMMTP